MEKELNINNSVLIVLAFSKMQPKRLIRTIPGIMINACLINSNLASLFFTECSDGANPATIYSWQSVAKKSNNIYSRNCLDRKS